MSELSRFKILIYSERGEEVGSCWGVECSSSPEFTQSDHFLSDDYDLLETFPTPLWYLKGMRIDPWRYRRKGYGSAAMRSLGDAAVKQGMKGVFARIADSETSKEGLVAFYRKNGWAIYPEDKNLMPRFGYWDLERVL